MRVKVIRGTLCVDGSQHTETTEIFGGIARQIGTHHQDYYEAPSVCEASELEALDLIKRGVAQRVADDAELSRPTRSEIYTLSAESVILRDGSLLAKHGERWASVGMPV